MRLKKFKVHKAKISSGFTLIELLIVIAIMSVLAVVVFVTLDPITRFKDSRNSRRFVDIKSIVDAIRLYQIENKGTTPAGLDNNWRMLGTASSGCDIVCGSGNSSTTNFSYSNQADFSFGNYFNSQWNVSSSWMQLIPPNTVGSYTSQIINSNSSDTQWSSFSYTPQFPSYKELPNNAQFETGYPTGNANMSGNVLLMHFNESAGATSFSDSSGNNNSFTCSGNTCPVAGQAAKLNGGVHFNGSSNRLVSTKTNSFSNSITVSAWIKPTIADVTNGTIVQTIYDIGAQGNSGFHFLYLVKNNGSRWVYLYWQYSSDATSYGYNSGYYILGQAGAVSGNWYHISITHNYTLKQIKIYVNGVLVNTINHTDGVIPVSNKYSYIGAYYFPMHYFNGLIDELSVFNRVLSDQEILNMYKRAATRIKFQVKSCTEPTCIGSDFIGPDGTVNSYYSELLNYSNSLPQLNITNLANHPYFQYKVFFETDNSNYSPQLKSVSLQSNSYHGDGDRLQPACLDLTDDLGNKLNPIPKDPTLGTSEKTYYAVKRDSNGQISAQACGAEGVIIKTSR